MKWMFCNMLLKCGLGCSVSYVTLLQKSAKDAKSMHPVCIFSSTVNIVYLGWEQNHYLDSRKCCAHSATYSCLGNTNHFNLTTDFSYCESPCSEVSNAWEVGGPFSHFTHAMKGSYCKSTKITCKTLSSASHRRWQNSTSFCFALFFKILLWETGANLS